MKKKNKREFKIFLPIVAVVIILLITIITIFAFTYNAANNKYIGKIKELGFTDYKEKTIPCYGDKCFVKDDMIITLQNGYFSFDLYTPVSSRYESSKYLKVIYDIFGDDIVTGLSTYIDKFISNFNIDNDLDFSLDLEHYDFRIELYDDYIVYNIRDDVDRYNRKNFPTYGSIEYYQNGIEATKFLFDTYTIGDNDKYKDYLPFLEYKSKEYIDSGSIDDNAFYISDNKNGYISSRFSYNKVSKTHTLFLSTHDYTNSFNFNEEYNAGYFLNNYKTIISNDIDFFNSNYKYNIDKNAVISFCDKFVRNEIEKDKLRMESDRMQISLSNSDNGKVIIYYKVINNE